MNYLEELVENAKESHGFAGRRAEHFKRLEKERLKKERQKDDQQEDKETRPYTSVITITLAGVGAFLLWYYLRRY